MRRRRIFSKAEMRDAAHAAAESGMCVWLHPTGVIEFTHEPIRREKVKKTPEEALEEWLAQDRKRSL